MSSRHPRRTGRTLAAVTGLALAAGTAVAVTPAEAATRPTWSTTASTAARSPFPTPALTGIRAGSHPTYDRVVLDISGKAPGYRVRYVPVLTQDGSGFPVAVRGNARLQIVLTPTRAHTETSGASTLRTPARKRWFLPQVKETVLVGDFEGYVSVGVGLAAKKPFRVFTLSSPTRIVVDVQR